MLAHLRALLANQPGRDRALAEQDGLTGLPDRRMLDFFLERQFAAARRGGNLSLVLFDLDRFQEYNARHGRLAGDAVLRLVGSTLEQNTRVMDVSGRFDGDAFLTIVPGEPEQSAEIAAQRVRRAVQEEFTAEGETVTVSAGVAAHEPGMEKVEDLIARADGALYAARASGGNTVVIASRGLGTVPLSGAGRYESLPSPQAAVPAPGGEPGAPPPGP